MSRHTTMSSRIEEYLRQRREAGFALWIEGIYLMLFARYADRHGHKEAFTTDIAIRWATALKRPNALTSAYRMSILRRFALHWHRVEPETEIPPAHLFGRTHRRLPPHIYTDQELQDLIAAANRILPHGCLRAKTYATIFGLIAATGLRISEALNLKRVDVDLQRGILTIRYAKFGKQRFVPLHATAVRALSGYVRRRDRDAHSAGTDFFFVIDRGRRVRYCTIADVFRGLRKKLNWQARGGYPVPRIHDIRHTFVCRQLEEWSRKGTVDSNILALSTYIGHVKVSKTYWYVTGTPELLAIAASRFEGEGERS